MKVESGEYKVNKIFVKQKFYKNHIPHFTFNISIYVKSYKSNKKCKLEY